jgi:hypothetical protein
VIEAESAILGCYQCSPGAKTPFWQILDQLRIQQQEGEVVYLLPVLACCPSCRAEIDEITLVEARLVSNCSISPLCEAKHQA